MKLRFRFSLRTLLLFVLLIGSSATLWWNWGPWAVAFTLHPEGYITRAYYSHDDAYILTESIDSGKSNSGMRQQLIEIFNSGTGKPRRTFRTDIEDERIEFVSSSERNGFVEIPQWGRRGAPALFRIETGEQIDLEARFLSRPTFIVYHPHYVVLHFENRTTLAELPGFERVLSVDGSRPALLSDDEELFAVDKPRGTEVFDVKTRQLINRLDSDLDLYYFAGDILCNVSRETENISNATTYCINARTGKHLNQRKGAPAAISDDGHFVLEDNERQFLAEMDSNADPIPLNTQGRVEFSNDCRLLLQCDPCQMLDARNGKPLWSKADCRGYLVQNGNYVLQRNQAITPQTDHELPMILHANTGECLFDFARARMRGIVPDAIAVMFAHHSDCFVTYHHSERSNIAPAHQKREVLIWRLTRPWQWYGPAFLPEFWLTTILALALSWSILRDRKTLKPKTVTP